MLDWNVMMKLHYEDVQGYLRSKMVSYYKGGEQRFFHTMTSINDQNNNIYTCWGFFGSLATRVCTCPFASWMLSSLHCVNIQAQACD